MKDGLIVTSCGAEALPFISAVGVLPATIAFFIFYGKVVSTKSSTKSSTKTP
jgi:AAA family ATP:ADP antiporter